MVPLRRKRSAATLAATSLLCCGCGPGLVRASSPVAFAGAGGMGPRRPADGAGFHLGRAASPVRSTDAAEWARSGVGARRRLLTPPSAPAASVVDSCLRVTAPPQPQSRSSTALFLETKEREEMVNGDTERMDVDGEKANGANARDGTQESYDLADFFDRIFQKESFGALSTTRQDGQDAGGDSGLGGNKTTNGLSDIQRSIESLTAEAEENHVPDVLGLTVDFASKVYQNMTEAPTTVGTSDGSGTVDTIDLLASSSSTFSEDLPAEIANSITELFRQLEVALDERFVEACEEIAFYDVQGLRSDRDVVPGPERLLEEDYERMRREGEEERRRRIRDRAREVGRFRRRGLRKKAEEKALVSNATSSAERNAYMDEIAVTSKRMKTTEILRNFNVAPVYYTIALFMRWVQKASVPPMALLMFFRGAAYPFKWREGRSPSSGGGRIRRRLFGSIKPSPADGRTKRFGEEEIADEEFIQGWKRTGEIAAKGKRGRALATFRRSAEIWFYFSSFYIKDAWILKNYNSGNWSKEKFERERGKLGAQLTQNLLRLGPTFIKVGWMLVTLIV